MENSQEQNSISREKEFDAAAGASDNAPEEDFDPAADRAHRAARVQEIKRKRKADKKAHQKARRKKKRLQRKKKRLQRKKKRRKINRLSIIIVVLVCVMLGAYAQRIIQLRVENRQLKEQNQQLKEERKDLQKELKNVNSDEYIEKRAREQLRLVNPDEILFDFSDDEDKNDSK